MKTSSYLAFLFLGLLVGSLPRHANCNTHPFNLQNAINAAESGSKIENPAGNFIGQFIINKSLSLEGCVNENGKLLTILDGNYEGSVLTIT